MKDHAGKFFSVWYGVYSRSARTITYSNAGHPPAVLLTRQDGAQHLARTESCGSVLGIMPDYVAPEITINFPPGSELVLFTDGLYELLDKDGGRGSYDEFLHELRKQIVEGKPAWEAAQEWHNRARSENKIDDDVTLLRFATTD